MLPNAFYRKFQTPFRTIRKTVDSSTDCPVNSVNFLPALTAKFWFIRHNYAHLILKRGLKISGDL